MFQIEVAAIWAPALLMPCSSIALAGEEPSLPAVESAVVPGGDITLRQIAHIEARRRSARVVVGRAPFLGQSRRVHRVMSCSACARQDPGRWQSSGPKRLRSGLSPRPQKEPIQVLLTAVNIPYNQIISEDMLQLDVLPAAEASPGALKSPEEAVGKRSTRYLRAGSVLTSTGP